MNLSLQKRVSLSLYISILIVFFMTFISFSYLSTLTGDLDSHAKENHTIFSRNDEMRYSFISFVRLHRDLQFFWQQREDEIDKLNSQQPKKKNQWEIQNFSVTLNNQFQDIQNRALGLSERWLAQLVQLERSMQEGEVKKNLTQLQSYLDSFVLVLKKNSLLTIDKSGISSVFQFMDKVFDTYADYQNSYQQVETSKQKLYQEKANQLKDQMLYIVMIGLFGGLVLALVIPNQTTLPFKKIKDAISELKNNNFDVVISYTQRDEIGEIAQELNDCIRDLKVYEQMRIEKISIEKRKFDVLANLVRKPVLVATSEGRLVYVNNRLYTLLEIQSEDVIGKIMNEVFLPRPIIDAFHLALKRRSKIENFDVTIYSEEMEAEMNEREEKLKALALQKEKDKEREKEDEVHHSNGGGEIVGVYHHIQGSSEHDGAREHLLTGHTEDQDQSSKESHKDKDKDKDKDKEKEDSHKPLFQGYAMVVPIRGKQSEEDYYLMVLSEEVFV